MTCMMLTDVNASNPCHMPNLQDLKYGAVMENPCNSDEIIVFGPHPQPTAYIYNKERNQFIKKIFCATKWDSERYSFPPACTINAVNGSTIGTLIVTWHFLKSRAAYYHIFNCRSMEFESIDIDPENDCHNGDTNISNIPRLSIDCHGKIHTFDHFMFVFQRFHRESHQIKIYNTDESGRNPSVIFRQKNGGYIFPAALIVTKQTKKKITANGNGNGNYYGSSYDYYYTGSYARFRYDFEFVVICGRTPFNKAFNQVNISIENNTVLQCTCREANQSEWGMPDRMSTICGYDTLFKDYSYHWYKSRYLIIIGGYFSLREICSAHIICFDFKEKIWYGVEKEKETTDMIMKYKMPLKLYGHKSLLIEENNKMYLYVFGGYTKINDCADKRFSHVPHNVCWKLKFTKNIDWEIERLIWIGYLKNDDDYDDGNSNSNHCMLPKLCKDIIVLVLSFVRHQFIFE